MPLSNKDLSDIAKELAIIKSEQANDKSNLTAISEEAKKKEEQAARVYIPYNNVHLERVVPYETERRWLDGTTYSPITQAQVETFNPADGRNTYFFPPAWNKSNAKLQPNANGNPTTTSPNSEFSLINDSIENFGIISQINLLRNGQSSTQPTDSLDSTYSPGASTISVNNTGHINGKYIYIAGSGTSALAKITGVSGTTLTILEIIPPANPILPTGSIVVENIPGFSLSERQTLTTSTYQRILTELTNRIIASVNNWVTALNNQMAQLNINIDSPAQISNAKSNINTNKLIVDTWLSLPNTGSSGKFVNTSLDDLAVAYNARNSFIPTRISQIVNALGIVTQSPNGDYSGNGLYLQRFKCLNFLINTANGALFQVNSFKSAKDSAQQKIANNTDKLATYSNLVSYANFIEDPTGNTVKAEGLSQFSVGDTVLLTGNDLPSIECQITAISGNNLTLSISIPPNYSKDAKGAIIKPL